MGILRVLHSDPARLGGFEVCTAVVSAYLWPGKGQRRTGIIGRMKVASAHARALVGLPGLYAGWVSAQEVAKHSRRPPTLLADLWVSERKLIGECGPDAYRRETALVETMLLPALIRGYVESNADVQGRVSYMLTPGGWTWLAAGNAPPDDDLGGEPDPDVAALYRERLKASFARLDTVEPQEPREIGYIPLPVAIGGLKLTEAERG